MWVLQINTLLWEEEIPVLFYVGEWTDRFINKNLPLITVLYDYVLQIEL